MKKTVIKRRKRVPAASSAAGGNASGRISDQAAAEALVTVGWGTAGAGVNGEDSEGETQEPKRKRARRSRITRVAEQEDEDVHMDGGEEESASHVSSMRKKRKIWDGRSVSPQNRAPSRSDYPSRGHNAAGPFAPTGSPHSGFDLPSFAVFNSQAAAALLQAHSSYVRSGSNAPSRTHSPGHHAAGYPISSGPLEFSPSEVNLSFVFNSIMGVPTLSDLERHYMDLSEHRRRTVEMLERTDRMLVSLKRGIEEMRGVHVSQQGAPAASAPVQSVPTVVQQQPPQLQHAQAMSETIEQGVARSQSQQPPPQVTIAAPTGEPDRPRGNVWPVEVSRD